MVIHGDEEGVAAGDQQHDQGQLQVRLLQEGRIEVRLEVVDGHERHVPHEGERLGRAHADEQGPDQTGTDGGGHGGHPRGAAVVLGAPDVEARLHQRLGHHGRQEIDVRPAGDLGHHAAVTGVDVHLAAHDRREHLVALGDDRRRCLVARGLDAEDAG